ncbi:MAG: sigma-54 dependent transcriptional regulator [Methylobacillus sp.]|jgi:DNA-binding NtrC family response regulator|nr:sigma-54 dependent transcriptional regulator [Methylobacillus sp.]
MQTRREPPAVTLQMPTIRSRILLVEDETLFARAVAKRLRQAGYECEHAETLADGRAIIRQFAPELVLLDMQLPDGSGMDLLAELAAAEIPVIVMTAYGEISDAVGAMKQGAADYLKKPVDLDELLLVVDKARRSEQIKHRLDYSRQRDSRGVENIEFIGDSPAMRIARAQIERIAQLVSIGGDAPPTVLITGETGTGKDMAARLLRQLGDRDDRPFVHVDCASLPAELIESELFGHEKGAFTSAQNARCGLIEAAEDGTLFMDEIGELPLALQAKLLNVLERRVVRRLGSTRERSVPARFIAATNRDLQQMVLEGRFRADLYYRLNVLNIEMPPLRQRGDDILLLAEHFARQTARRYGLPQRSFAPEAQAAIRAYDWPGNVRELKHLISRGALLGQGATITLADLALPGATAEPPPLSAMRLEDAEKTLIVNALKQASGNVSEAARLLGITRMTIRYRMEKHGIREV